LAAPAGAQTPDSALARHGRDYVPERLHLHFDKSAYFPGETVWFKAYLMEGILPAEQSKTLYVDWIDESGKVLYHSVSPVADAGSNGQFEIPATYAGRALMVRAYTKWMLNFEEAFLFHKVIPLLSTKPAPRQAPVATLRFFPEGGDAIAGIRNRVAFKCTDQWGAPVKVSGVLLDGAGKVMDSVRAQHDGMGLFYLQPEPGVAYKVRWKDAAGKERTDELPAAKKEGIALEAELAGGRVVFAVKRQTDAADRYKQLNIVGTMHGSMVFRVKAPLTELTSARGGLPVKDLPSGILTLTVFDDNWNAMAERIVFVNNDDYRFRPTFEVKHWGLSKRARNEVEIAIPENIGANLSVSVTDAGLGGDSSQTILSTLLLTGELRGQVYRPAYYFSADNDTLRRHLDLVMLTNGWRRFKWEDIVKGKMPATPFGRDTTYLTLSGKVLGLTPGSGASAGPLVLMMKPRDSAMNMSMYPLAADGSFNDPNLLLFDTMRVYYQLKKGGPNPEIRFMPDRLAARNLPLTLFPPMLLHDTAGYALHARRAAEMAQLIEQAKGQTLEGVTVKARTKSPLEQMEEKYASGLFRGNGQSFDLINDPFARGSTDIFQFLQGKVAGLIISGIGPSVSLKWRGGTPQVFLDEMPVTIDMVQSIPVQDVAFIKVFTPPFLGSVGGGSSGAIALYTRRGNDVRSEPSKGGMNAQTIAGYTPIREFSAPNYSTFDARNEQRDVRTTLYWNPRVLVEPGKKVVLRFYNNDVTNAFRVVIEGISGDGRLTHVEEIME
ncbi:MAG TPA: hypothetical protein VHK69_04435, partial [Chitinophagaceae bacterium]|nr:hypothetical protein [Chitinophagaceae bacterium]